VSPPKQAVEKPRQLRSRRPSPCDIPKKTFLKVADSSRVRLVFEFRHESWFTEEVYRLLSRHDAALCIADSPSYPRRDVLTAEFTYLRFHGRTQLFASRYSTGELAEEAQKIKRYLKDGIDVFVYFNNDALGHAVENARMLRRLLERRRGGSTTGGVVPQAADTIQDTISPGRLGTWSV
jgi:uncharacterized protein YecE (DUF72 family)